jgi:hypothetical protein
MIQGWHNNDYLILFEEKSEAVTMNGRYGVTDSLPDYNLVGLKSWDDFILRDVKNQYFTVPTVPLDAQYVQPFVFGIDPSKLRIDERYASKIKWYIKPLVFGGDANADSNVTWLTVDEHVEAVKWWNQLYRDVQLKKSSIVNRKS